MQAIDLRLNDNMEVIKIIPRHRNDMDKEFDFPNFPYICYEVHFDSFIGKHVHWHWHNAFHFIEVLKGNILLRTGAGSEEIAPGDVCFINNNANHCLEPINPPEECCVRAYILYSDLICGNYDNTLATKYIQPIMNQHDLYSVRIPSQDAQSVREHLHKADEAHQTKEYGYEFDVRYQLSLAWIGLLQDLKFQKASIGQQDLRIRDRMRTMLNFIRTNYTRKIDLDEIAESAMISQRECFRCFQKTMGITPTHYLQNFRVRQAARMLLETDDTVADISQSVGFSDTSYFGKTFQKYMNCSPTEYRKRHLDTLVNLDQVDE